MRFIYGIILSLLGIFRVSRKLIGVHCVRKLLALRCARYVPALIELLTWNGRRGGLWDHLMLDFCMERDVKEKVRGLFDVV